MAAGLPRLRFRAGVNTDEVLVGNVGCDWRVSYTCLGDGVNVAIRLAVRFPSSFLFLSDNVDRQHWP